MAGSRLARTTWRVATAAVTAVVLGAAVLAGGAYLQGCRTFVVRSGSMGTAAPVGSVVLMRPVDAAEVTVGDVLMLDPPPDAARAAPVVHRVIERTERDGKVVVRTKGDTNAASDPHPYVVRDGSLVLVGAVPLIGYGVGALRSPLGWLVFIVAPIAWVALRWLRQLWTTDS